MGIAARRGRCGQWQPSLELMQCVRRGNQDCSIWAVWTSDSGKSGLVHHWGDELCGNVLEESSLEVLDIAEWRSCIASECCLLEPMRYVCENPD